MNRLECRAKERMRLFLNTTFVDSFIHELHTKYLNAVNNINNETKHILFMHF